MAGEAVETVASAPSKSDLRSQILASIDAEPEEKAAEPPEVEETEDEEAAPAEVEPEAVEDDDAEDDSEADEDDEPETSADPETQKRLNAVRMAEKRSRAAVAKDRAEFEIERKQHADDLKRLGEFQALAKRIKYDPGAALRLLGASEDDFETIAQAIYAESKAGAADPKRKEMATRLLREREKEDKLSALEKRHAELEAKLERQAQEAEQKAQADRYVEQLTSTANTKHPLVAHMLKADPDGTTAGLAGAYERLLAKGGSEPKPAAVVAEYDRAERARLKRIGVDPDTIAKAKPAAVAKIAAKANGTAKPAPSAAPTRDQILAELEQLAD